ncbi:MAG TPA: hypothetical protein PLN48_10600 [Lachnospiraceae bacterium]|nr:hypothetical protein [Lachnospiraceae bacterium]
MRINPKKNGIEFLKAVGECSGSVYFDTPDGNHLNLKSILSQYVFSAISGQEDLIRGGSVLCSSDRDIDILRPYLLEE